MKLQNIRQFAQIKEDWEQRQKYIRENLKVSLNKQYLIIALYEDLNIKERDIAKLLNEYDYTIRYIIKDWINNKNSKMLCIDESMQHFLLCHSTEDVKKLLEEVKKEEAIKQ